MKIPSTIHFAGFDFKIIETANLDVGENWGRTDMARQEIHLNALLHPQKKIETLIHELIHIAYRHTSNELDEKIEEHIVKPWSKNIFGILRDNNLLRD